MAIINLGSEQSLKDLTKDGGILQFYADWCGPCRALTPKMEEISKKMNDISIIKVNTDDLSEIALNYDIQSIPAVFYVNGSYKKQINHSKSVEDMISEINEAANNSTRSGKV